jgi:hypothetical protein
MGSPGKPFVMRSLSGTERTAPHVRYSVAIEGKADLRWAVVNRRECSISCRSKAVP